MEWGIYRIGSEIDSNYILMKVKTKKVGEERNESLLHYSKLSSIDNTNQIILNCRCSTTLTSQEYVD